MQLSYAGANAHRFSTSYAAAPEARMSIAMIGSRGLGSYYGGIEKVLDEVCPRLAAFGHRVDVFGRAGLESDVGGAANVPVVSFGGKHFENITRSAVATAGAIGRYDIVHFHGIGPGILSAMTAFAGQTSVVTVHGLDWRRDKWNPLAQAVLRAAQATAIRCSSGVSVVSRQLYGFFQDRCGIESAFVPNGMQRRPSVPLGAFGEALGIEEDRYILFASRLVPEKGCHDLLEAFARVPGDMKLVIAGTADDPAYAERLRSLADPRRVIFTGHRSGDELTALFSNAYLFILPSYVEGMSNALLEAMAVNRAVLVSDIEENLEVVGDNGFAFRVGDVDDLAKALDRLVQDADSIASMRQRLANAQHVDWDTVTRRYLAFYRSLLQPQDAPAFPAAAQLASAYE